MGRYRYCGSGGVLKRASYATLSALRYGAHTMLGTTRILLYVYVLRSLYELIDSIVTLYLSSARPHTLIDYRPFIVPRKSPFNWRTPADLFFPFLLTLNTSKQRSKANKELVPKPDFTHSSSIYFHDCLYHLPDSFCFTRTRKTGATWSSR